jgi:hypothetical protein
MLQSIIFVRSFTIHQLTNAIINELPKLIQQFSDTKVIIVISDLLSMFVNDPKFKLKKQIHSVLSCPVVNILRWSLNYTLAQM